MPEDLAGTQGTVTVRIPGGGRPGEVLLEVDNQPPSTYTAYCDREVERGLLVVVYGQRPGRAVDVEPL